MKGTLYLVSSSMGENSPISIYNDLTIELIHRINYFIVENTRSARRFIRFLYKEKDIDQCHFFELNKHEIDSDYSTYLTPVIEGNDIIVLSDAGCPTIADPGGIIVRMAHEKDIKVVPVPGPSAIYLALASSGLNGQKFQFHGYLPIKDYERKKALISIDARILKGQTAEIFMETPYRNQKLFEDIINNCSPSTFLCIAQNLTLPGEKISTKSIADWSKSIPNLKKELCVFILGK